MSHDAKIDALQWEIARGSATPGDWIRLARLTAASSGFADAVSRANAVTLIYERSLRACASSYKLWMAYIAYRRDETRQFCGANEWFHSLREVFERAVAALPQMPLLWAAFLELISTFPVARVTLMRHVISHALVALPATQHHIIWRVAKRWCTMAAVPVETFKAIWRSSLQLNRSIANRREYLTLLMQKGDYNSFLLECIHLAALDGTTAAAMEDRERLIMDLGFWEPVLTSLQTKGWRYTGDMSAMKKLVELGASRSASSIDLKVAYAVFLCGQGLMTEGRRMLRQLLEEAPEPATFVSLYRLAVEVEDQLVESFAVSEAVNTCDDATYAKLWGSIFDSADPLAQLKELASDYPLLLNQSQLRNCPTNVCLWLKRIELLQENMHAGRSTAADLLALCRQAVQQCTAGMETVDVAVGELFHTFGKILVRRGCLRDAAAVLSEGAFSTPFHASAVNITLLGHWLEVQLLQSSSPQGVIALLQSKLNERASGGGSKRARTGLLQSSVGLRHVIQHPNAWMLLFDLYMAYSPPQPESWRAFVDRYTRSTAFTAESACYAAYRLHRSGRDPLALVVFERGLAATRQQPVAQIFILSQYFSFLIQSNRGKVPLHQFREAYLLVQQSTAAALHTSPSAVLELHYNCAELEAAIGLYGNAVRMVQEATELALRVVPAQEEAPRLLLQAALQYSINFTEAHRGYEDVRRYCARLVGRLQHPLLLHRVAVHWAAIEKRSGNPGQAHIVLDACGNSQDPSTSHGEVYWNIWESLCQSVQEFEKVARRRQQASVYFRQQS